MFLLDTDTLSLVHSGHPEVLRRSQTVTTTEIAITVVTRIEMLRGRSEFLLKAANAEQLLLAQALFTRTEELLRQVRTIPFDVASAAEFDRLRQDRILRKVGGADLLIAAIAFANQATLVSRNLRHFRAFTGLRLDNWAD